MGSLGMFLHWDCNAMGDAAKTSPRVPSTCAQNAILSLLIIDIIPSRQIYVAIDNLSLVPSVSCHTTSSYLRNYVRAANDVSNAEILESNCRRCFSQLYKFRVAIHISKKYFRPGRMAPSEWTRSVSTIRHTPASIQRVALHIAL